MAKNIQKKILLNALTDIPFDGLNWETIIRSTEKSGCGADVANRIFPSKVTSFLQYFSAWSDKKMLEQLKSVKREPMRMRDRIRYAVWSRLEILEPHKEVVRLSLGHWINPLRKPIATKMIWKSSDVIWEWAGDMATDYNHYTKRALLSGVIMATILVWVTDNSEKSQKTADFLDRRIDNVLVVGKLAGKILKKEKRDLN